ncbi:MAG: AAA domain-containing protein [Acidaminobacteraceae bacterium]
MAKIEYDKVYLKDDDKTKEIETIEIKNGLYEIKYLKNDKIYKFKMENVEVIKYTPIFIYLNEIAKKTTFNGEFSILGKHYDKIKISENDLLHKYLNGASFYKKESPEVLDFPFGYNKSQYNAVKSCFENELSIIQGPPGTGKTQTILNIIANLVMENKTVAVVSNNIPAVMNVIEKLEVNSYQHFYAYLGNENSKKLFFENYVTERNIDKSWEVDLELIDNYKIQLENLSKEIMNLLEIENRLYTLKEELKQYNCEYKYYQVYYENNGFVEVKNGSFLKLNKDKVLDFVVDNYKKDSMKKRTIIDNVKLFFKYGFYKFKDFNENEAHYIASLFKRFYELKIEEIEEDISLISSELINKSFDELKKKHIELSELCFKDTLYQRFSGTRDVFTLKDYKNKHDIFFKEFPLIFSTSYSITNSIPQGFKFDYVLIDEASTVDIVKGILPFSCAKNIVLVGDLKQLSHVEDRLDYEMCDPLYDNKKMSILASVKAIYKDNVSDTLLKEHYRCHPSIIRFCNKKFYNDQLVVYNNYTNNNAVMIIKTVQGNHSRKPNGGSLINNREIDEAAVLCSELQQDIFINGKDYGIELASVDNIGFATPFNAQVEKAKEKFGDEIEVDTVHKYQGRENDVFVFSTVLDKSMRSSFLNKFVSDPRLVNVAVSRAKKYLIIISSCEPFMKSGNHIGDLIRYVNYVDVNNVKEGKIYSVFDLLYKEYP